MNREEIAEKIVSVVSNTQIKQFGVAVPTDIMQDDLADYVIAEIEKAKREAYIEAYQDCLGKARSGEYDLLHLIDFLDLMVEDLMDKE